MLDAHQGIGQLRCQIWSPLGQRIAEGGGAALQTAHFCASRHQCALLVGVGMAQVFQVFSSAGNGFFLLRTVDLVVEGAHAGVAVAIRL
ncbi:hypothetical protein D3C72_1748470 [compost metagenome]